MDRNLAMNRELAAAFRDLPSSGTKFDRAMRVVAAYDRAARPFLLKLLTHPDPDWQRAAATAFARLQSTPSRALPGLLRLVTAPSTSGRVAALAAMDWLPTRAKNRATPTVVRVLLRRPAKEPTFTGGRSHVPRAVAAQWLGLHGGTRGIEALRRAKRWREDPVLHQVEAALGSATGEAMKP